MPPKKSGSRSKKYTIAAPVTVASTTAPGPAGASRSRGKTPTTASVPASRSRGKTPSTTAAPASRSRGKTPSTTTTAAPATVPATVPAPVSATVSAPVPEAEAAAAAAATAVAVIPASATPSTFSHLMERVPIPLSEIKERVERSAGSLYNGFMNYVQKGKKALINEAERKSRVEKEYKDLNEEQKEMWKMGVMATTAAVYAAKYAAIVGAGYIITRTLRRGGRRRNRNTRKRHSG